MAASLHGPGIAGRIAGNTETNTESTLQAFLPGLVVSTCSRVESIRSTAGSGRIEQSVGVQMPAGSWKSVSDARVTRLRATRCNCDSCGSRRSRRALRCAVHLGISPSARPGQFNLVTAVIWCKDITDIHITSLAPAHVTGGRPSWSWC
jgi:hypothetical protein